MSFYCNTIQLKKQPQDFFQNLWLTNVKIYDFWYPIFKVSVVLLK